MVKGRDFLVSKEVYDRAVMNRGYMATQDQKEYFDDSILCGYGLYNCTVREENGKYICSWWSGSTCD